MDGDDLPPDDGPLGAVGPVRRRKYEPSPKHGPESQGFVSREPRNGQAALDVSVPVKPTAPVRVGIDYDEGEIVVFRRHDEGEFRGRPNDEVYHGYVVPWPELTQQMRNALMRAGMANRKGRIL
jgi:hypothetical protein